MANLWEMIFIQHPKMDLDMKDDVYDHQTIMLLRNSNMKMMERNKLTKEEFPIRNDLDTS